MLKWFKNLSDTDKIAIVVAIGLAVIREIIEYFSSKNDVKTI